MADGDVDKNVPRRGLPWNNPSSEAQGATYNFDLSDVGKPPIQVAQLPKGSYIVAAYKDAGLTVNVFDLDTDAAATFPAANTVLTQNLFISASVTGNTYPPDGSQLAISIVYMPPRPKA